MALFVPGKSFVRALESSGALGVYAPLEGGFEGRYQRRLRAAGYETLRMTARGLGNPAAYLTDVHGVRPAHLGKKNIGQTAAVGPVYYVPPIIDTHLQGLGPNVKGLVLWIIEGMILSRQEMAYLANLPKQNPRIKVILELGGERYFRWESLPKLVAA